VDAIAMCVSNVRMIEASQLLENGAFGGQLSTPETKRYLYPVRVDPGVVHGSTVNGDDAHGPGDILGQGLGHRRTILSIGPALSAVRGQLSVPARDPVVLLRSSVAPPRSSSDDDEDDVLLVYSSTARVLVLRLYPYPSTFSLSPSFSPVPLPPRRSF